MTTVPSTPGTRCGRASSGLQALELGGVSLRVCAPDSSIANRVRALIQSDYCVSQRQALRRATATIHLGGISDIQDQSWEEHYVATGARAVVIATGAHAEASLDPQVLFQIGREREQRDLLLEVLLLLFRGLGRFGLHAAGAVSPEGTATLIVGKSGSGKSTLTVALIRQGWRFLSDDALVLWAGPSAVDAMALRRGFSLTEATGRRFLPDHWDTAPTVDQTAAGNGSEKRQLDLHRIWAQQFRRLCVPRMLLFPHVGPRVRTELIPISKGESLARLIEESPGILCGGRGASRQMTTLSRLVAQCRCFHAACGADVLESPAAVARLLLDSVRQGAQ